MPTHEYAPGRLVDIHGDGDRGVAVLWHGRQPDSRDLMAPLARAVAEHGVRVLVPDWCSTADDLGRSDVLLSTRYAREICEASGLDPGRLVVGGWSLGGTAAASLTVHAKRLGISVAATVLIAPGDGPRAVEPISGAPLADLLPPGAGRGPVHVLHGRSDPIVPPHLAAGLASRLIAAGWSTTLTEVTGNHETLLDDPLVAETIVSACG